MVFLRKPLPHEEVGQDNPSTDINVHSGTGANAHPGPAGTVAVTLQSTLPASDDVRPHAALLHVHDSCRAPACTPGMRKR